MAHIALRFASIMRLRLRSLFSRGSVEEELDEELRYHLERQIDENLAAGMSREYARSHALQSIRDLEQRKEECRDMRGFNLIDNLTQDFRFAVRQLRKNPGFTATAILMPALGLCASVAIFAFVDAALIKPLPYRDPARLVSVFETFKTCPQCNVSYLNFRDWQNSTPFFDSLAAFGSNTFLLRTPAGAQPAAGTRVSDGFFHTLGIAPLLGRDFRAGEDAAGAPRVVLLSYCAWQKRFGGKRDVLGQAVILSDVSYSVIGVLPRDFEFSARGPSEFWTTLNEPNSCEQRRGCHNLFGIARLKEGVSAQSALTGMKLVAQRLEKQYADSNRGFGADVVSLSEATTGKIRPILLALLSGAGLLLLIACVNISSLLLVRSESRKREMAVRNALGASAGRLVRQFITEGLVLVSVGTALGLVLASWTIRLLAALIPADQLDLMPFLRDLSLNVRVVGFAGVVGLLAAAVFSLTPALRFARAETREGLAEGSRGSAGTLWRHLGSKLVLVELATAVVLLVSAGLLGKSLYRLLHVSVGLQPDRLATLMVTIPPSYQKNEQVLALERQIIRQVGSLPGIASADISTELPLRGWGMAANIVVVGRPWNGEHNTVPDRNVSSGYLKTLGATLLRGRSFTEEEDDPLKPGKVVINLAFAREYFPSQDAIGKQIAYEGSHEPMDIIGIVRDIQEGPLDSANRAAMYTPFTRGWFRSFGLIVRATQDERALLPAITMAVHAIDPDIATDYERTMREMIDDSQAAYLHRSSAWVVGGLAAVALVLGCLGCMG